MALSRLPGTDQLRPGESLASLVQRLAALNGYSSAAMIFSPNAYYADETGGSFQAAIERLAVLTMLPTHELLARSFTLMRFPSQRVGDRVFLGNAIRGNLISHLKRRTCVLCLRDRGYHRAIFDITVIDVCPDHHVRLTSTCPTCRRALKWDAPSPFMCTAEAHKAALAHKEPAHTILDAPLEHVPEAELAGLKAIGSCCEDGPASPFWPNIPEPVIHLPSLVHKGKEIAAASTIQQTVTLSRLFELVLTVARLDGFGALITADLSVAKHQRGDAHRALNAGWGAIRSWPVGFHDFLDRWVARQRQIKPGAGSLEADFGSLYDLLANTSRRSIDSAPWPAVRAEFLHYLATRWDGATAAKTILGQSRTMLRLVYRTLPEAKAALGVTATEVKLLAEAGHLNAQEFGVGADRALFVTNTSINALKAGGFELIGQKRAGEILGTDWPQVQALMRSGQIPILARHRAKDRNHVLINRYAVESLVRRVRAVLPCENQDEPLIAFSRALANFTAAGLTIVELLGFVVDSTLPCRHLSARKVGLAGIKFAKADVDAAIAHHHAHHPVLLRSRTQAAALLKLDVALVGPLLKAGILTPPEGKEARYAQSVSSASIATMAKDYITLGELARRHQTNRHSVRKTLDRHGVNPAFHLNDKASLTLYRVTDIASVDISVGLQHTLMIPKETAPAERNKEYKRRYRQNARLRPPIAAQDEQPPLLTEADMATPLPAYRPHQPEQ